MWYVADIVGYLKHFTGRFPEILFIVILGDQKLIQFSACTGPLESHLDRCGHKPGLHLIVTIAEHDSYSSQRGFYSCQHINCK